MTKSIQKTVFHVISREKKGTGNSKKLRKEGRLPGNIFGLGEESIAISVDYQGFKKLYENEGDTGLIYLEIDENKKHIPVLITDTHFTNIGQRILHASFKRVNLNEKIEAEIPVELIGEAKIDQAIVSLLSDTVLVEAFPADLPEKFEIDISELTEVGQSISLADLVFDKEKVSLVLGEDENPSEVLVVNVQAVKEEVEEVVEDEVEGDGESADDGGGSESQGSDSNSEENSESNDDSDDNSENE